MAPVQMALRTALDAFMRNGRIRRSDTSGPEPLSYGRDGMQAGVRYWGEWVMPPGEDDDGDYDWKVLSPESQRQAAAILTEVQKQFPTVSLSFSQEEKYWLSLEATPK
jgi:hypothetical protein